MGKRISSLTMSLLNYQPIQYIIFYIQHNNSLFFLIRRQKKASELKGVVLQAISFYLVSSFLLYIVYKFCTLGHYFSIFHNIGSVAYKIIERDYKTFSAIKKYCQLGRKQSSIEVKIILTDDSGRYIMLQSCRDEFKVYAH